MRSSDMPFEWETKSKASRLATGWVLGHNLELASIKKAIAICVRMALNNIAQRMLELLTQNGLMVPNRTAGMRITGEAKVIL